MIRSLGHRNLGLLLLPLFVGIAAGTACGQQAPDSLIQVRTVWQTTPAHAGDRSVLAVVLDIRSGYHINPDQAQIHDNFLIPTQLKVVAAPSAVSMGPVWYPKPKAITVGATDQPRQVDGYEGRVVLYLPVQVGPAQRPGLKDIDLELTYQACDRTQCLAPVTMGMKAALDVVDSTVPVQQTAEEDLFEAFVPSEDRGDNQRVAFDLFGLNFSVQSSSWFGFTLLLLVAACGGLLLNFTPCVLPVIPLKMMGLSKAAGNRSRCLALGVSMSLGVLVFWMGLGGMIAGVRGVTATNQLFQYPPFTIALGVLIAMMATGTFGLFTVRLPRWVYAFDPKQDTLSGSFGLGVMTAVLATPCTAPFMGAAAAWAATQHPATTLTTFFAIGTGMALPYLLLSAFPVLVQRMPRTGPGSELIKQVIGLLLLAAAAYFLGVGLAGLWVRTPDPPTLLYWWPVMAFVAMAGGWLAYRTIRITISPIKRWGFGALGILIVVGAVYGAVRLVDKGPVRWVYYTPERLAGALDSGKVIVMDFTAEWCLNCKWLEKNVLQQSDVASQLNHDNVVAMKVDLTGHNEAGSRKLQATGRVAIPLLWVLASDGTEVFKSDFYTSGQVIEAVAQARAQSGHPVQE